MPKQPRTSRVPSSPARNLMSKKGSSDVFVSVALGSRDRSFSIWSTDLKRPLVVVNDVFDQSVLDLSWSKDGKVRFNAPNNSQICVTFSLRMLTVKSNMIWIAGLRATGPCIMLYMGYTCTCCISWLMK